MRKVLGFFMLPMFLLAGLSSAKALDEVTLRLNWQILGFHTMFYYGVEKGFYKDEGIDLKISEGRGGGATAQAIAAKSDMLGIVDGGTTIVSAVRGLPVKTVMSLMNRSIFAIVSRDEAPVRTPKDLEGRTIAATAGDALTQLFPAVVKVNNLDRDKIRILNVDAASKVIAVLEKRADAVLGSIDAQNFDLEAKGVKPATLTYDDMGVPLVGLTVIAHEDTIKDKGDVLRRFVRATQKTVAVAAQDLTGSVAAARKVKPEINADVSKRQLEIALTRLVSDNTKGKPIGWGAQADWASTLQTLKDYQGLKTEAGADAFYTNAFVP